MEPRETPVTAKGLVNLPLKSEMDLPHIIIAETKFGEVLIDGFGEVNAAIRLYAGRTAAMVDGYITKVTRYQEDRHEKGRYVIKAQYTY